MHLLRPLGTLIIVLLLLTFFNITSNTVLITKAQQPLYVAFVWHFHQPWYKNPYNESESLLPWVRLHALKSYYHMVKLVADFQGNVSVTFNVVGSLMKQLIDYVSNNTTDKWWDLSKKPVANLTLDDKIFIVQNFFSANWDRQIPQWPRYKYLLDKRENLRSATNDNWTAIALNFTDYDYLDLQVFFNLVWFNKGILYNDPDLYPIWVKARDSQYADYALFNETEKQIVLDKIYYYLNQTITIWRQANQNGWAQFITTPGFHPIAPLLINTSNALRRTLRAIIPYPYFSYPEDVGEQMKISINLYKYIFNQSPTGIWPAEEAVCNELLPIVAEKGINHLVTDQSLLKQFLGRDPTGSELYSAWYQDVRLSNGSIVRFYIFFRDIGLSNLISFNYDDWLDQYGYNSTNPANNLSDWELYKGAAQDLVNKLYNLYLQFGGGHLVVIALDGENPWEWYWDDGWRFLYWTYKLIADNTSLEAISLSQYIQLVQSGQGFQNEIWYLPTGSWIDDDGDGIGDLMRWIGEWEENVAWQILLKTRQDLEAYDPNRTLSKAWWYMYAAEGSDWFWWYGRDQEVPGEENFDYLFRLYIKFIYDQLNLTPDLPWPIDVPIHYRSGTQVQWVGRQEEAIWTWEGQDINFTIEVYGNTSTNTTADPGQLEGIRMIILWSPVEDWGGIWYDTRWDLMTYLGDSGNNDVYNYTFKNLAPGKYEVAVIANTGYDQNGAWSDAYSTTWSLIGNYRIEVLPLTNESVTSANITEINISWDGGFFEGSYNASTIQVVNASSRDIVKVIVRVYAPNANGSNIYAILRWGGVSTWGAAWWPVNDYVGEYIGSDSQGYHYYVIPIRFPRTGLYEAVVHVVAGNDLWVNLNGANIRFNITDPIRVQFNVTAPSTTPTGTTVYFAPSIGSWSPNALALYPKSEWSDVDLFSTAIEVYVSTVPQPIPEPRITAIILLVAMIIVLAITSYRNRKAALVLAIILFTPIMSVNISETQWVIHVNGYLNEWVDYWIVYSMPENVSQPRGASLDTLWVTWNDTHLLIAFNTSNDESWNVAYGIAIDYDSTPGSGYNGTSDAWNRAIGFSNATILPEIMVYFWWNGSTGNITAADIAVWNGSAWNYYDFENYRDGNPILPDTKAAWNPLMPGDRGLQTIEIALNWTAITGQNFTSMLGKTLHIIVFVVGDVGSSAVTSMPYDDNVLRDSISIWERNIYFPAGLYIEYKYTRGNWSSVEGTIDPATGACVDIANRAITVPSTSPYTLSDTIDCWRG